MNNKRLTISLIATVLSFFINMGISFFLTPFIVQNIGSEAYGFVSLAQNFTNYAQIITVALNSMSGRFITIAYHRGDKKEASKYMTSTFYANIFMCLLLLIPSAFCICDLENIINITPELVADVKLLFIFIFLSFFVSLLYAAFSNATYISNRKDLDAKRNIESYVVRVVVLVVCYVVFKPKLVYVGIASIAMSVYVLIANIRYLKTLTPDLHIKKENYSFAKVKTLVKSGFWNSFNNLSNVLSTGLDLLIANLFISSDAMGTLSIAKQLPGVIQTLIGTIGGVFAPNYTIAYAKGDKKDLLVKIRQSMIVLGTISNLCLIVLVVIGKSFFTLWLPDQDADHLQLLSILTIAGFAINGSVQCIFNIYVITNKIRANALVSFASNLLTVGIVFFLLNTTNLGIYAIASVSTMITIIRNIIFSIPYAAHCIKIKLWFLFKPVLLNLIALIVCALSGSIITARLQIHSWLSLILVAGLIGVVSLIVNLAIITTKDEKIAVYEGLKRRMSR